MKKIIGLLLLTGMAVFIAACSPAEETNSSDLEVTSKDSSNDEDTDKANEPSDNDEDSSDGKDSSSNDAGKDSSEKATNNSSSQAQEASSTTEYAYFQTPSKNIWCNSHSPRDTACVIKDYEFEPEYFKPPVETREECEFDWEGMFAITSDSVFSECVSDTSLSTTRDLKTLFYDIPESDIPVLEYGETNRYDGVTCVSEKSGLSCSNANGQNIKLSKDKVELTN